VGQTQAAQDLCVNIPPERKQDYMQLGVGHYGVFNGSKFRSQIAPRICEFHARIDGRPLRWIEPRKEAAE
jgi:poly(3-hydroxybutyrate) depolymerase